MLAQVSSSCSSQIKWSSILAVTLVVRENIWVWPLCDLLFFYCSGIQSSDWQHWRLNSCLFPLVSVHHPVVSGSQSSLPAMLIFTYCRQVFISFEYITLSHPSSCIQIVGPQPLHSFPPKQLLCCFTPLIVSFSLPFWILLCPACMPFLSPHLSSYDCRAPSLYIAGKWLCAVCSVPSWWCPASR